MNGKHAGEEYKGKYTKIYRGNDRGAAVSQEPMKNKCYTFQRSLQLYKLTIKNCFSSHTTVFSHMFLGWTLHGKKSSTETYLPPIWSRP